MKCRRFKFVFVIWAILAFAGFSAAVMLLWNALMPGIFHLVSITFWQAAGLLLLARIFFGRFGGGRHGRGGGMHMMGGGNPLREKWMNMSAEERKEFMKRRMGGREGFWGGDRFFGEERCHGTNVKENENSGNE